MPPKVHMALFEINAHRKKQYPIFIVQLRTILSHLLKYIMRLRGTECALAKRCALLD